MNKLNEEILAKFLMGECTEDELREVNAWLEESGENARELFRLEEIYHLGRLGDTSNTQDIEKAEKRLFKRLEQEKTKQYKVRRMVGGCGMRPYLWASSFWVLSAIFFIRLIASRKHYWLSPLMIRLRN